MRWDRQFLTSTRGRMVSLLRRSARTVGELADALEVTSNAVRGHLAGLERDGVVERRGVRRGLGKPAQLYGLTGEAERLFPKAYGAVLGELLGVLAERLGAGELEAVLAEAGRRAAAGRVEATGDAAARLAAAAAVIGELGGAAEVEAAEGGAVLRGYACPLAEVVPEHPRICRLAETLLAEVVGAPVRARCEGGERPRCLFEVALAAS